MKRILMSACFVSILILVPVIGQAQVDKYGFADTVYADVAKVDDQHWTVTVSFVNDEYIAGMTVPLKLNAGTTRIVGDSAVYSGGRVDHFSYKFFRADTAIQCVLAGMVANLGPTNNTLGPGSGRLFTFYISSFDGKPIEKLIVDTATVSPNNSLMAVADRIQRTDPPDTLPYTKEAGIEIIPVFVVREPK